MADPVAEKSAFLRMYMSNHPDTLVAYAKFYGKVQEPIKSAEMTAIDTKSMTLNCTMKNGGQNQVRIVIEPPLRDYNDVKPRLLEMKALAQEGLGMIKAPHITNFQFPAFDTKLGFVIGFVSSVSYLYLAPQESPLLVWAPAQLALTYPGVLQIASAAFYVVLGVHVLESLYTLSLCRKHYMPAFETVKYLASTLFFGFPIWSDLRRRIQEARIDSVMKVQ